MGAWEIDEEEVPRLMTIKQACEYTSFSRSKLYDLMGKGEFRVVRLGHKLIRLTRASVDAYLNREIQKGDGR